MDNKNGLTVESVKLLPCPFCGHTDIQYRFHTESQPISWSDGLGSPGTITFTYHAIYCGKCYAKMESTTSKERAIEEWNRRSPVAHLAAGDSGWRPIATAPRDGTVMLLYWPTMSISHYPAIGMHHDDEYGWELLNRDYGEVMPTHWMPLCAPPTPPDEGDVTTHNQP